MSEPVNKMTDGEQRVVMSYTTHMMSHVHLLLTFWSRNYFFNFSTPVYKM